MDKSKDPELRDCVVKLRDDHEVEAGGTEPNRVPHPSVFQGCGF
jgi:hypothetical protein